MNLFILKKIKEKSKKMSRRRFIKEMIRVVLRVKVLFLNPCSTWAPIMSKRRISAFLKQKFSYIKKSSL